MTNTQKPRALPGTMCPLWRKDVSKVCHTCHLWDSIRVRTASIPPQEYDHWDCTYRLHTLLLRDIGLATAGVRAATEERGNEICKRQDIAFEFAMSRSVPPRLINGDPPKQLDDQSS